METPAIIPLISILGANNCQPILHMSKRIVHCYTIYETINQFEIGYMINPSLKIIFFFPLSGYAVLWGACGLVWEEGGRRGGGGGLVCLCMRGVPCSYRNRASTAPSSHCGLCTLILCAGTCDPLMHRWVARTIVMATLLVTYPHVCE